MIFKYGKNLKKYIRMKGIIYRIYWKEDISLCYVGSTETSFEERKKAHKDGFKSDSNLSIYPFMKEHGFENFEFDVLAEYNVVDTQHLKAYEQLWMNKLHTCVNIYCAFNLKLRQCPYCYKKLHDKYNLDNHIKAIHQGVKYTCPFEECEKQYAIKQSLNTHIKSFHKGIKIKYFCEHEKRKSQCLECSPDNFCEHIKRRNECIDCNNFYCEPCDRKFSSKRNLKKHFNSNKHIKNIHI